jgi:hypothetical protein
MRLQGFNRRLAGLEKQIVPTEQEIMEYLQRAQNQELPGDKLLAARIEHSTPDYIRRMTNEELKDFVLGKEPGCDIE